MLKNLINKIWESKRTPIQKQEALQRHDYTGGYTKILPWVWYNRKGIALAAILNLILGLKVFPIYFIEGTLVALITGLIFAFIVPALIAGLLYREFKEKKRGIAR